MTKPLPEALRKALKALRKMTPEQRFAYERSQQGFFPWKEIDRAERKRERELMGSFGKLSKKRKRESHC
jgi:hypothetical protein